MGLLEGRVAIVTGAGRGLGRAHALALSAAGAAVVVNDVGAGLGGEATDEAPADVVVAEIRTAGGSALAVRSSVSDWDACDSLVQQAITEFGRLDILVNNAGITRDRMLTSSTEQDFDATFAVHVKGSYALSHHACRYWREEHKRGGPEAQISGRIINTTSGSGMFGNIGQSAYGSAKSALIGLTITTALEMRRYGVTANAISPIALTRMTERMMTATDADFDPRDPANASGLVVYLGSRESGWLTGQVLRIDGDRVQRMGGWHIAGEYASAAGGAAAAEELLDGIPAMYGTVPAGVNTLAAPRS
jgi:NAD(P)-dependent dehydrogenase (short-subunit alcohol dehydrogenase family)